MKLFIWAWEFYEALLTLFIPVVCVYNLIENTGFLLTTEKSQIKKPANSLFLRMISLFESRH